MFVVPESKSKLREGRTSSVEAPKLCNIIGKQKAELTDALCTLWKSDRLLLQPSLGCIRRLLIGRRIKCQKYCQLTQNKDH